MTEELTYEIIRSARRTLSLELRNGEVLVRAPYFTTKARIEAFVSSHEAWLRRRLTEQRLRADRLSQVPPITAPQIEELKKQAKQYLPQRVACFAPIIGVTPAHITIRLNKTRWGSCSSKGGLNFNCLLMLTPPEVIDSVVVHELCHMKHMNHSKAFYEEVRRHYPDYDKWNRWLKENGREIIGRASDISETNKN